MYINFSLSSSLICGDIEKLTAIKQKETEWLHKYLLLTDIRRFEELDFISRVKCKKGQENSLEVLRLSDKGKKFINNLSFEGVVDTESQTLADWVIKIYSSRKGGFVKNKTELARRIQWFKTITSIGGNYLALLIQCTILDTYDSDCGETFYEFKEKNPRGLLSNMGENLFWSPTSIMDKHKTLDKSPLYNYYIDNQSYVEGVWRQQIKTENENGEQ